MSWHTRCHFWFVSWWGGWGGVLSCGMGGGLLWPEFMEGSCAWRSPGWESAEDGQRRSAQMHWEKGGLPPSRARSLCPATVPLTPSASLNGICNQQ